MEANDIKYALDCLNYLVKQAREGVQYTGDGDAIDIENNAEVIRDVLDRCIEEMFEID